ncbi:hypothetical protein Hte_002422 [Hypoxylon texense]
MGQNLSGAAIASPRNHSILPFVNFVSRARYVPTSPPVVQVVVEKEGRLYLVHVNITNVDSVEAVMVKVRATREKVLHQTYVLKLLHDAFWGQRITMATLCTFRNIDFSSYQAPLEVNVRDREPCIDLERPDLTDDSEPFIALYPELLKGSDAHKCVLVERELKKHNILACAFVGIVVAIAAGMLVGFFSHNIGFGLGTSAGIIGTIAFLVPLSTWVTERTETE